MNIPKEILETLGLVDGAVADVQAATLEITSNKRKFTLRALRDW
ncbi:hypothetical protein MCHI_003345 [Candidatus Magnetoovum chiemensis]|nr:hypothetical protein MCHI_003345 [Candidatus Magnetoovum chiemensis]